MSDLEAQPLVNDPPPSYENGQHIDQPVAIPLMMQVKTHPEGYIQGRRSRVEYEMRVLKERFLQMRGIIMLFNQFNVPVISNNWVPSGPSTHDTLSMNNGFNILTCYDDNRHFGQYQQLWLQRGIPTQEILNLVTELNIIQVGDDPSCITFAHCCAALFILPLFCAIPALQRRKRNVQRSARDAVALANENLFHSRGISVNYHRLCNTPDYDGFFCACGRDSTNFNWLSISLWDDDKKVPIFPPGLIEQWDSNMVALGKPDWYCTDSFKSFWDTLL